MEIKDMESRLCKAGNWPMLANAPDNRRQCTWHGAQLSRPDRAQLSHANRAKPIISGRRLSHGNPHGMPARNNGCYV